MIKSLIGIALSTVVSLASAQTDYETTPQIDREFLAIQGVDLDQLCFRDADGTTDSCIDFVPGQQLQLAFCTNGRRYFYLDTDQVYRVDHRCTRHYDITVIELQD